MPPAAQPEWGRFPKNWGADSAVSAPFPSPPTSLRTATAQARGPRVQTGGALGASRLATQTSVSPSRQWVCSRALGRTALVGPPELAPPRGLPQDLGTSRSRSLPPPPGPEREAAARRPQTCALIVRRVCRGVPRRGRRSERVPGPRAPGAAAAPGGPAASVTSRGGASAAALGAEPRAESAAPERSREERTPRPRWSGSKVRTRVPARGASTRFLPLAARESRAGDSGGRHCERLASLQGSGEQGWPPPPNPDLGRRLGPPGRRGPAQRALRWRLRPGPFDPPWRGGLGGRRGEASHLLEDPECAWRPPAPPTLRRSRKDAGGGGVPQ